MNAEPVRYHRYRFPPLIISHAVWLYHRFCLSFRDVEDLLAQRGVTVSYETVRHWCQTFGLDYARRRALELAQQADAELDILPSSPARDALRDSITYAVERRS